MRHGRSPFSPPARVRWDLAAKPETIKLQVLVPTPPLCPAHERVPTSAPVACSFEQATSMAN